MENQADCFEPICEKEDVLNFKRKSTSKLQFEDDDEQPQLPLGRNTLGVYAWGFLHTTAIYYPDHPTQDQQNKMNNFIQALAEFYPCKVCRSHFKQDIDLNKPQLQSRKDLSIWFCQRHNEVNKMLNKPQFDCSFDNLEKRWRTGQQ